MIESRFLGAVASIAISAASLLPMREMRSPATRLLRGAVIYFRRGQRFVWMKEVRQLCRIAALFIRLLMVEGAHGLRTTVIPHIRTAIRLHGGIGDGHTSSECGPLRAPAGHG